MATTSTLSQSSSPDESCFQPGFDFSRARTYCLHWLLCIFGAIGNSVVIHVFSHKTPRATGEHCILVLALTDLAMCCVCLIFTLFKAIMKPNARDFNCFVAFCVPGNAAFDITFFYSCGMMCMMAVNRYLAVCRPHDYSVLFSVKRQTLFNVVLLALALLSPGCGIWNCVTVPNNHLAKLLWVIQRTLLLAITSVFMAVFYRKVVAKMHELKTRVCSQLSLLCKVLSSVVFCVR